MQRKNLLPPFAALLILSMTTVFTGSVNAQPIPGGYVQLTPNAVVLTQGSAQQIRAAVLNPLGFELPNRTVTWTSSHPAIATVSASGLITAVTPGRATITAKSGAALGTASITVNGIVVPPPNTPPNVRITQPADGTSFTQGSDITFTATATDTEDGILDASLVWSAAIAGDPNPTPTSLGTGARVTWPAPTPGSYLVTARATDSGGFSGIAQVGITINPPCVISASLLPLDSIRLPQILQLDATGSSDSCGRFLQYIWGCTSTTNSGCAGFLNTYNADGNTHPLAYFQLYDSDSLTITLRVCAAGTNECAPQLVRRYTVASLGPM